MKALVFVKNSCVRLLKPGVIIVKLQILNQPIGMTVCLSSYATGLVLGPSIGGRSSAFLFFF